MWGKLYSSPCVSKTRHNITINKVACLRHADLGFPSPPHTALRFVWGNRIKCSQHIYRTLIVSIIWHVLIYDGLSVPKARSRKIHHDGNIHHNWCFVDVSVDIKNPGRLHIKKETSTGIVHFIAEMKPRLHELVGVTLWIQRR